MKNQTEDNDPKWLRDLLNEQPTNFAQVAKPDQKCRNVRKDVKSIQLTHNQLHKVEHHPE